MPPPPPPPPPSVSYRARRNLEFSAFGHSPRLDSQSEKATHVLAVPTGQSLEVASNTFLVSLPEQYEDARELDETQRSYFDSSIFERECNSQLPLMLSANLFSLWRAQVSIEKKGGCSGASKQWASTLMSLKHSACTVKVLSSHR